MTRSRCDETLIGPAKVNCGSRVFSSLEEKTIQAMNSMTYPPAIHDKLMESLPSSMSGEGFGSKILRVTASMLDRAAVWPGKMTCLSSV